MTMNSNNGLQSAIMLRNASVTARERVHKSFERSASQGLTYKEFYESGGFFDVVEGYGSMSGSKGWKIGVVYRCIAVIAETIGSLKLELHKQDGNISTTEHNHKSNIFYKTEPNGVQTWYEFLSSLVTLAVCDGNAYIRVFRDFFGNVRGFTLLKSGVCVPYADELLSGETKLYYFVNGSGVSADDIIHIKCLGSDGYIGDSVLTLARRAIDAATEQQELSYAINKNGLNLQGVLEAPSTISDTAYERIRTDMEAFRGAKNANGTMILEEGLVYKKMSISPTDAEFVANRDFTVEDICRFFGVPPHKVMSLKRSTNNNIEHQDLEFYKGTILSWLTKIEQQFDKKILSREDRIGNSKYKHRFDIKTLIRGDSGARAEFYNSMFAKGAISPDEIRQSEGLNPINSEASRATYVQLAMSDISKLDENRGNSSEAKPKEENGQHVED